MGCRNRHRVELSPIELFRQHLHRSIGFASRLGNPAHVFHILRRAVRHLNVLSVMGYAAPWQVRQAPLRIPIFGIQSCHLQFHVPGHHIAK